MIQTSRLNQVLSTLEGINSEECRGVMSNYDSFKHQIQQHISIQTFIAHFRRAEINYLNGNEVEEKKSLKTAMKLINSGSIKDIDLKDKDLRSYKTGTMLTSQIMSMRLRELE